MNPVASSTDPETLVRVATAAGTTWLTKLHRKAETGATAVEYALMVGLIAVGIITAVASLRDKTSSTFNTVNSAMGGSAVASPTPSSYFQVTGTVSLLGGQHLWSRFGTGIPAPTAAVNAASAGAVDAAFIADTGWTRINGPATPNCAPRSCYQVR
jgi:pilus assembly protein Flp/PilA